MESDKKNSEINLNENLLNNRENIVKLGRTLFKKILESNYSQSNLSQYFFNQLKINSPHRKF
jgi:hypothetical protein